MQTSCFHDDVLGDLTWNEDLDWWEGSAELAPGLNIRFSISQEEANSISYPVEEAQVARKIMGFLGEHEIEARIVASEELLDLYNAEWTSKKPLTEEEFINRLTLDDVSISFDGSAELYYRDDDLFEGHTLLVTIGADGTFQEADLAG